MIIYKHLGIKGQKYILHLYVYIPYMQRLLIQLYE